MRLSMDSSWRKYLKTELSKPYFATLETRVVTAYQTETVFPPQHQIFTAFSLCTFTNVKVVILGQDPYHGEGQAQGLSFSVPNGTNVPPSLKNIYKELSNDIGKSIPTSGNLEHWARQGVLLLNATLTVLPGKPGSHQGIGWEQFTDAVIRKISDDKKHVVFLLWGKYAQAKSVLIDSSKHLILQAPHPSPFSARTGFFGCKHFSQTNEYLKKHGLPEIIW